NSWDVTLGQTRDNGGRIQGAAIPHSQASENTLPEKVAEPSAAYFLDHACQHNVPGVTVTRLGPWLEEQGFAANHGHPCLRPNFPGCDLFVIGVGESRLVGEQMPKFDLFGGSELREVKVEPVGDFQFAVVLQKSNSGRGERLCYRGQQETRVHNVWQVEGA